MVKKEKSPQFLFKSEDFLIIKSQCLLSLDKQSFKRHKALKLTRDKSQINYLCLKGAPSIDLVHWKF